MKLEKIGFYTLSDYRARNVTIKSPIQRGELILTDRCNLKCPYCRGLKKELQGNLTLSLLQRNKSAPGYKQYVAELRRRGFIIKEQ